MSEVKAFRDRENNPYYIIFPLKQKVSYKINGLYVTAGDFGRHIRKDLMPQTLGSDLGNECWSTFVGLGHLDMYLDSAPEHNLNGNIYECIKTELEDIFSVE